MLISPTFQVLNEAEKQPYLPFTKDKQLNDFKGNQDNNSKWYNIIRKIDFSEIDVRRIVLDYFDKENDKAREYYKSREHLETLDVYTEYAQDKDLKDLLDCDEFETKVKSFYYLFNDELNPLELSAYRDKIEESLKEKLFSFVEDLPESELSYEESSPRPDEQFYYGAVDASVYTKFSFPDKIKVGKYKISIFDLLKSFYLYEQQVDSNPHNTLEILERLYEYYYLEDCEVETYPESSNIRNKQDFINYFLSAYKPYTVDFYNNYNDNMFNIFYNFDTEEKKDWLFNLFMETAREVGLVGEIDEQEITF